MQGFQERHIYDQPPTRAELAAIAALLPGGAEELLSRRSNRYAEMGFRDTPALVPTDPENLLDLLAAHPRLLKRPIVTDGRRAVVGYDEEALHRAFATTS